MTNIFLRLAYDRSADAMNIDGKFSLFCDAAKIQAATFVLHHSYDSGRKKFAPPCDLGPEVEDLIKR